LFYNVENLFDFVDDPIQGDDEFLKNSLRVWTEFKYRSKVKKISQAILAANDWQFPALIGLSEIENRRVLNDLCSGSLLSGTSYKILHQESGDHRGIDVGLLYNPEKFVLIDSGFYEVRLSETKYSREILYAQLRFASDTLHVFVCHWPSRYSGTVSSEDDRMLASNLLYEKCKEVQLEYMSPKILIMGDFNDEPKDKSLMNISRKILGDTKNSLINLMDARFKLGTIKYQNQWYLFDQFLVSGSFFASSRDLCVVDKPKICFLPFLMVDDEKHLGKKPFRTFVGYKYQGGYSDHLPILLKLNYR
jgi:hypothetical protein